MTLCPTCKNNLIFAEGCNLCIDCGKFEEPVVCSCGKKLTTIEQLNRHFRKCELRHIGNIEGQPSKMEQKKNYWTWCKDCSPFWIYCKDCDEYHTFKEVPCVQELAIKNGKPLIHQLPALPEDERGAPLWTPDMKGTAEGNLMEWVFPMQLEHQKRKEVDGRIDWGTMMTLDHSNLEEWV